MDVSIVDTMAINTLMAKGALLMLFIERATAQYKAIKKTDLKAKPWPLVSLIVAMLCVVSYDFYMLNALLGGNPELVSAYPMIPKGIDFFVSSGILAGGSAGIIDSIKALKSVKKSAKDSM